MSFYGKVVQYFNNVFQKIQAGNDGQAVEIDTTDGSLIFKGDQSLVPEVERQQSNVIVSYTHRTQKELPEEQEAANYYVSGYSNDPNENTYYLGLQAPKFDRYGHAMGGQSQVVAILSISDDGNGNVTIGNPEGEENIIWIGQDYYTQY